MLEVLVAFGIVLLTAVFVFQLLPASVLATRHSEVRLEAQQILVNTLEGFRQRSFDGLVVGPYQLDPVMGQLGVVYKPRAQLRALAGAEVDRALELEVEVEWNFRSRDYRLRAGTALWRVQQ